MTDMTDETKVDVMDNAIVIAADISTRPEFARTESPLVLRIVEETLKAYLAREMRVTDEDVDKFNVVYEEAWTRAAKEYPYAKYGYADTFATRASLESFAQTLGEPVAVPDGWKLVPSEPTKEMIAQACLSDAGSTARAIWQAMYYAASLPAAAKVPDDNMVNKLQAQVNTLLELNRLQRERHEQEMRLAQGNSGVRDAERYRWLRVNEDDRNRAFQSNCFEDLDEVIDAALSAQRGE